MQITIVQVEIEEAIRNHILSLIDVKEGKRIDITLKATRGDEGATAIINIVDDATKGTDVALFDKGKAAPAAEAAQEAAVEAEPAPQVFQSTEPRTATGEASAEAVAGAKVRKTLGRPSKAVIAAREAEAASSAQETPAAETQVDDVAQEEPVEDATEEESLAAEAARTEPEEPTQQEVIAAGVEPEPTPVRPSLFSGLNKPKN